MSAKVFVGGLPYIVDEARLRETFQKYGVVSEAKIIKDTNGQSRGFGFVTYNSKEEADSAVQALHNQDLDGRIVKVNHERPQTFGQTGGGRGNYRGDGYGGSGGGYGGGGGNYSGGGYGGSSGTYGGGSSYGSGGAGAQGNAGGNYGGNYGGARNVGNRDGQSFGAARNSPSRVAGVGEGYSSQVGPLDGN